MAAAEPALQRDRIPVNRMFQNWLLAFGLPATPAHALEVNPAELAWGVRAMIGIVGGRACDEGLTANVGLAAAEGEAAVASRATGESVREPTGARR
jgi:hypothetical protein